MAGQWCHSHFPHFPLFHEWGRDSVGTHHWTGWDAAQVQSLFEVWQSKQGIVVGHLGRGAAGSGSLGTRGLQASVSLPPLDINVC